MVFGMQNSSFIRKELNRLKKIIERKKQYNLLYFKPCMN